MAAALGTLAFVTCDVHNGHGTPVFETFAFECVEHGAATSTPGATALYWPESLPRGLGGVGWTFLEISWWRTENFAKTLLGYLFKAKSSW